MRRAKTTLLVASVGLLACSATDGPRAADPTAGAWVEVALVDPSVPADPITQGGRAPTCHLEVHLSGATVLSEPISPQGSRPPYSVDSTFRFTATPGEHSATVYYAGCRTFQGNLDSREAHIAISVRRGYVTKLRFDGARLEAHPPVDLRYETEVR
jgi:hypothetical protein